MADMFLILVTSRVLIRTKDFTSLLSTTASDDVDADDVDDDVYDDHHRHHHHHGSDGGEDYDGAELVMAMVKELSAMAPQVAQYCYNDDEGVPSFCCCLCCY